MGKEMISDHYEVLRKNKTTFWWFLSRRELFIAILSKFLKRKFDMGIDIGCGPLTNESLYKDFAENWFALDYSKKSFEEIPRKKFFEPIIADVHFLPLKDQSIEICFLLDVLEHIENEKEVLSEIVRILKKDGLLLLSVPAFNILWSFHDEQAGHKRRYTKKMLLKLSEEADFEVLFLTHFNATLFLPILIIRKILKITSKGENVLEIKLSPKILNRPLCFLLKLENFINLRVLKIPFGTSVVALLRKK